MKVTQSPSTTQIVAAFLQDILKDLRLAPDDFAHKAKSA